jgi:hypothetical protein
MRQKEDMLDGIEENELPANDSWKKKGRYQIGDEHMREILAVKFCMACH